jgi:hypothetical protein
MRGWGLFFFLLFLLVILAAIGWILFTQIRARRSGLPAPTWRSYLPFMKSSGSSSGFSNLPSPRSSNPLEWIKDKINLLRHGRNRTAQGHYEEAGGYASGGGPPAYSGGGVGGSRRARAMDPDEAWDTRVGNEADAYAATGPGGSGYYEEQELGPTPGRTNPYAGGAAMPAYGEGADARGRSKSRDPPGVIGGQAGLDTRYGQEMGGKGAQTQQRGVDAGNPFSDANEAPSLRGVSPRPVPDFHVTGPDGKGKGGGAGPDDSPSERRSMFRESL